MNPKYGIPFEGLPEHCLDAVEAAETVRARSLIIRAGNPVAAIVPMADYDKIDPPDPGVSGSDPLLALCGSCRHDAFVDAFIGNLATTGLWRRG